MRSREKNTRIQTATRTTRVGRYAVLAPLFVLLALTAPASGAGFVGEGRCANPTCHGASPPSTAAEQKDWAPWKSARTQWLNSNIDRHSRAYRTLQNAKSKQIAGYMNITATESIKCRVCHAPPAQKAAQSNYEVDEGVTCEHCHGAAEAWVKVHVEKDWPQKRAQYVSQGFYNNNDFRLRAEKCASCHVKIDHEIIAGGHPPLQFEMVAYAQVMKHWDDSDEKPKGWFDADPTIWGIGQVVGLRHAVEMVSDRAGTQNYQGLSNFSHFKDRNCYECHHKLLEDALRQASGHYAMVDVLLETVFSGQKGTLDGKWSSLKAGVASSAEAAAQRAGDLREWLAQFETQLMQRGISQEETRAILKRVTVAAQGFQPAPHFVYSRPPGSNVLAVGGVEHPWWYTTGPPEQAVLAVLALCPPGFGNAKCKAIDGDITTLVRAADRINFDQGKFSGALKSIGATLK
jgi:Cytochrome c554 and c-prime